MNAIMKFRQTALSLSSYSGLALPASGICLSYVSSYTPFGKSFAGFALNEVSAVSLGRLTSFNQLPNNS
jgi:hypothetical protein